VIGIATAVLVPGPGWGLLLALTHLYVFVLAPSNNDLGHRRGRRNFGNNSATNLRVHHNHHAYPSSPKPAWAPSNSIRRGW
jgi:hypothetical protein